jgi:glutamate racemase
MTDDKYKKESFNQTLDETVDLMLVNCNTITPAVKTHIRGEVIESLHKLHHSYLLIYDPNILKQQASINNEYAKLERERAALVAAEIEMKHQLYAQEEKHKGQIEKKAKELVKILLKTYIKKGENIYASYFD